MESKDEKLFEFHIKHYEYLHTSLLAGIKEERQMEKNVMLGCAIFYSWLATHQTSNKIFFIIASFIPSIIVVLSILRSYAIDNGVRTQAEYLRKLEDAIYAFVSEGYDGPKGWENFLLANKVYSKRYENSQHLFWYIFLSLTIAISICFYIFRGSFEVQPISI